MGGLLEQLLARNDYIAVDHGRLILTPKSGQPVPPAWLARHQEALLVEIAELTGAPIFQYQGHKAKKFGSKNYEGVVVNYTNLATKETAHLFFNCHLTRARTTKAGKKGDPLPKGHFRLARNQAFAKYWFKLGLPPPRRGSEYHAYMGHLKKVYITGVVGANNRIDKETLAPFSASFADLCSRLEARMTNGNSQAISGQWVGNSWADNTGKYFSQTVTTHDLQPDLTTGSETAYLSNQGSAYQRSLNDHSPVDHIDKCAGYKPTRKQTENDVYAEFDEAVKWAQGKLGICIPVRSH